GVHAHASVSKIHRVAIEAEQDRAPLGVVAKAYALHVTFDDDLRGGAWCVQKAGGRGERIWTSDFTVPNRARYQAPLRPAPPGPLYRTTAPTHTCPPAPRTASRRLRPLP